MPKVGVEPTPRMELDFESSASAIPPLGRLGGQAFYPLPPTGLRPLVSSLKQSREGHVGHDATLIAGHDAGRRTEPRVPHLKVVVVAGGGLGGLGHLFSLVVVSSVTLSDILLLVNDISNII